MLAHSFLYRIFKLPRVLNPIFYIGGLINSIYYILDGELPGFLSKVNLVFAHSFLYRIFKLPRVLNPIFYIGGLINSMYSTRASFKFNSVFRGFFFCTVSVGHYMSTMKN